MTNVFFSRALLAGFVLAGSAFFCASATAQYTSELGIGIGATNYRGDVSPKYQLQNNRPAFTVFYRKDISVPVTLRAGLTAGLLRADDGNVNGVDGAVPPLQTFRQVNTKGSVYELSGALEYNFLDYHRRTDKVHFTPYVFVGLAIYYANTTTATNNQALANAFNQQGSTLGLSIPGGVGIKLALSDHINLGLETGVRPTFSDDLDHLSEQTTVLVDPNTKDWYYYSGVSLSYTFYSILCPTHYRNNTELLR